MRREKTSGPSDQLLKSRSLKHRSPSSLALYVASEAGLVSLGDTVFEVNVSLK